MNLSLGASGVLFFCCSKGGFRDFSAVGIIVLLLQTLRRDSTDDSILKVSLVLVWVCWSLE